MKQIVLIFIGMVFITSCATIGPTVSDNYLDGMTKEQSKLLLSLEEKIIQKKKEKDAAEAPHKIAGMKIVISKMYIDLFEQQRDIHKKELDLYDFMKNDMKKNNTSAALEKSEKSIVTQKALYNYYTASEADLGAIFDVKTVELAVLIATYNNEKAKIADSIFQNSLQVETKTAEATEEKKGEEKKVEKKKEPKSPVNLKEYADYLKKMQDLLDSKTAAQKNTAEALSKATAELKESGFQGEL